MTHPQTIVLDGYSLTCTDLLAIGYDNVQVQVSEEAYACMARGRSVVDDIVASNKVVYGINTGFGNFASVTISKEDLSTLQKNLVRSHAAGVGQPLSPERARMLLALRINVLCKGNSGIRPETVRQLVDALNKSCVSWVPEKGTVGASGDLAPLAHMALGMMGEGKMWNPTTKQWENAAQVLAQHGLTPIDLQAKEGLALINGTQLITSLGAEAIARASILAKQADVVAALTLEALKGTFACFDARIHTARGHKGQIKVAKTMRALLLDPAEPLPDNFETMSESEETKLRRHRSEISESHRGCNKVQDSYTLRCIPQVHGVVHDSIEFCKNIINVELNAATDNPMVFADSTDSGIFGFSERVVSGGNFHGEYPAKALDFLAITVHEIAQISERRIDRLVDSKLSGHLPPFLVAKGGLNSGFMMAHVTAAALTSENKTLVHPASSDSLTTSAGKEDHVSMGGWAARKCLQIVENVENVVAIELMSACQALDFMQPLKTSKPLEAVHALVRERVPFYEQDRFITPDIEAICKMLVEGKVWSAVKDYIKQ